MARKEKSEALAAYWQQRIDAWQESGQSQRGFCETSDLNYHRFGYWVRKFRNQADQAQHQRSPGFVPVTVNSQNDPGDLSLTLSSGMRLQGITNDNLPTVYQLLAHLS